MLVHGAPRELDLLTDDAGGVVVNAAHLGIGAQGSCKGPSVLIALVVSGCMSGPAGLMGGVELGSGSRVVERCPVRLIATRWPGHGGPG